MATIINLSHHEQNLILIHFGLLETPKLSKHDLSQGYKQCERDAKTLQEAAKFVSENIGKTAETRDDFQFVIDAVGAKELQKDGIGVPTEIDLYINKKTSFVEVEARIAGESFSYNPTSKLAVLHNGQYYQVQNPLAQTKACRGHGCVSKSYAPYFIFGENAVRENVKKTVFGEHTVGGKYADITYREYFKIGLHKAVLLHLK